MAWMASRQARGSPGDAPRHAARSREKNPARLPVRRSCAPAPQSPAQAPRRRDQPRYGQPQLPPQLGRQALDGRPAQSGLAADLKHIPPAIQQLALETQLLGKRHNAVWLRHTLLHRQLVVPREAPTLPSLSHTRSPVRTVRLVSVSHSRGALHDRADAISIHPCSSVDQIYSLRPPARSRRRRAPRDVHSNAPAGPWERHERD